jgi:hypothetical protein
MTTHLVAGRYPLFSLAFYRSIPVTIPNRAVLENDLEIGVPDRRGGGVSRVL